MAEINLQRKGPSGWLWSLGVVAILLVVLLVARTLRPDFDAVTATGVTPPEPAPPPGIADAPHPDVAAFVTFADTPVGSPAGPAHEYTAEGTE